MVSCSCCSRPSCFTRRVFSLIESLVQLLSSASLSRTHSDSAEFSFQVVVHPNSWWPFLARIIERRPKLKELLLLNDGCVSDYCGQNGRRHHHGRSNWKLDVVNVEKSAMGVSALHWPQNRLVHPFSEKKNSRYDRGNKTRKKKRTIEILKIKLVYCFSILLAMFLAMPFVLLCMARKKEEEKVLSALSYRTKSTVRIYLSFNSGRFSFVHSLRNNDNKK